MYSRVSRDPVACLDIFSCFFNNNVNFGCTIVVWIKYCLPIYSLIIITISFLTLSQLTWLLTCSVLPYIYVSYCCLPIGIFFYSPLFNHNIIVQSFFTQSTSFVLSPISLIAKFSKHFKYKIIRFINIRWPNYYNEIIIYWPAAKLGSGRHEYGQSHVHQSLVVVTQRRWGRHVGAQRRALRHELPWQWLMRLAKMRQRDQTTVHSAVHLCT